MKETEIISGTVEYDKHENVSLSVTISDFNKAGFEYGDSVDIFFDNGKQYRDIPYFNGYYGKVGQLIVCGYPGYSTIDIAYCQGTSLYKEAEVNRNTQVRIVLNQKHKYLQKQNSFDLKMTNSIEDYEDVQQFANFRMVDCKKIKSDCIYRSCTLLNSSYKREKAAAELIQKSKVKRILSLADNQKKAEKYINSSDNEYLKKMYDEKRIYFVDITENFKDTDSMTSLAEGINWLFNGKGPYAINCIMGINRTGFTVMLLMALVKCDINEIISEYMKSYVNYYHIDEKKYEIIVEEKVKDYFDYLLQLNESDELNSESLYNGAVTYLKQGGLDDNRIKKIIERISNQ